MAKNPKSVDDAALDENVDPQGLEDAVIDESDDTAEQETLDEDQQEVADKVEEEELEEEPSEDEIEPELLLMATAGGMTDAEAVSMGRTGLLSYLAARTKLKKDDKKEPEEDPFVLNLSPEEAADLSPALVLEIKRIAAATRDRIAAAKEEVGPLKEQMGQLIAQMRQDRADKAFVAFQNWCETQKDDLLGNVEKPKHKARERLWKEVVRVSGNLGPNSRMAVSDICEIAYNKAFKGQRRQQARRKVAKEADKQSDSAVGRASTVARQPGNNYTRKTSEEAVRALLRRSGMS